MARKQSAAPRRLWMVPARLEAVVHVAEEGGYWAEVPTLPGCYTQAETLTELRRNIRAAVDLYLDAAGAGSSSPGAPNPARKRVS